MKTQKLDLTPVQQEIFAIMKPELEYTTQTLSKLTGRNNATVNHTLLLLLNANRVTMKKVVANTPMGFKRIYKLKDDVVFTNMDDVLGIIDKI